jgi:Spy/CpxP family protein refolding chaperone
MSELTPTPTPPTPNRRRRFLVGATIASIVAAGVGAGLGVKAFAHGPGFGGWHHRGFPGDPAGTEERLDRMLRHLYIEIDATEAQQQQLGPIVKDAMRELAPLRAQLLETRRQVVELLARDTVDRQALEALRASKLQLAEQASSRLTRALADVADVLTPEQRRQLAERLARHHGHHG